MFNRDQMMNAPAGGVSLGTFKIIDAIQREAPHIRVLAGAAYFLMVCRKLRVDPQDAMQAIDNMLSGKDHRREHFAATIAYMENEL